MLSAELKGYIISSAVVVDQQNDSAVINGTMLTLALVIFLCIIAVLFCCLET